MRDYLEQFDSAPNQTLKWRVSQQYQGQTWNLGKTGISVSEKFPDSRFYVTRLPLEGYGSILVASDCILSSSCVDITVLKVEPPRTKAHFDDCECPLFYYGS